MIADPPFGITDEPWEPEDVEGFNREWSRRWAACGADFVAIFWCQSKLWEGRQWFDESLKGYEFQQMLVWHANNQCGPKSRSLLKQTWYPIFLYRRKGSSRKVITDGKTWSTECHQLDCHVAAVPQTGYRGEDLKQHPCQKSSSAMRWLINAFSDPGAMVCSLFCGVAPCGVAAVQLGRRYRGIEQSAEYRKIAEGRIAAYKDQPQQDDQDEEEILRAAAEIRQRRVAERLKEIQEQAAAVTTCANQETWRSRPSRRLPRPDPNPGGWVGQPGRHIAALRRTASWALRGRPRGGLPRLHGAVDDRPCAQDDAGWIGVPGDPSARPGWGSFGLRAADPTGGA